MSLDLLAAGYKSEYAAENVKVRISQRAEDDRHNVRGNFRRAVIDLFAGIAENDQRGDHESGFNYAGKVLLVVNTATRCGFTPQYEGLEAMYERLKGNGFELLDFPCNQFGQQAPGTDEEIHSFCVLNYKTAFPQFARVEVNGENAAPLFQFLVANTTFGGFPQDGKLAPILEKILGEADPDYAKKPDIKWNFTKFLVGKDGRIVRRFEPTAPLAEVEEAIRVELAK